MPAITLPEIEELARQNGFSAVYCLAPKPFTQWAEETAVRKDVRWNRLCADPLALMPEAKSLLLFVWAYRPYSDFPEGSPSIDAYYTASQTAFAQVRCIAESLRERGFQANYTPDLPARQALLRTGESFAGRCAVASLGSFGTRIHLQQILTDAPLHTTDARPEEILSPQCTHCSLCMQECPVSAIQPHGAIDTQKCLRALSYSEPIPLEYRAKIGCSVIGCDICQRTCPRNAKVVPVPPPEELVDALRLERLLAGDGTPLAKWIGTNYARPVRLQARGALIAANLRRYDLLPQLQKLCESPRLHVREHAIWAVQQLL